MRTPIPLLAAALLAGSLVPEPARAYDPGPPQSGITRAERERRKAKKKQAQKSKRRNKP